MKPYLALAGLLLAACGSGSSSALKDTMPSPATHAQFFPIAPGDVHGPIAGQASVDCNACHLDKATGQPSTSFLSFSCTGCHVAAPLVMHDDLAALTTIHLASPEVASLSTQNGQPFSTDDAACLKCHPAGTIGPPANHGEFFDISAGGRHPYPSARILGCATCHTSANRTATTDFACATCHAADATPLATGHAAVPDFAADPKNPVRCLACHANGVLPATAAGQAVTVSGHAAAAAGFTIGSGAHAGAAGGACLTCHPASRAPSATPPHWDYARDFTQTSCVACHVAVGGGPAFHDDLTSLTTLHASVATFTSTVTAKGLGAACLSCHPDGAGGAPPNHPSLFPIAAGTKHAGIACGACHTNPADRKDLTALACASCHAGSGFTKTLAAAHAISGYAITTWQTASTAGGTRTTVQVDMTSSLSCLRCHADAQVDRIASHPGGDSGFGKSNHHAAGCLTCHSKLRADKPWGALFSEAKGASAPPTGCYVCHASGSGG